MPAEHPRSVQPTRCVLRDLLSDAKWAKREGREDFADESRRQLRLLFPLRNTGAKLDRYGWPLVLKQGHREGPKCSQKTKSS